MRTLIIAITLFVFSSCFSQEKKEEFSKWNLSVSGGSVYFIDKNVYYFNGFYNNVNNKDDQIPLYDMRNWSMNYYEVTASYFFSQNHELGVTLGSSVFSSPHRFFHGYHITATDTTINTFDGYKAYTDDWWGFFYNFHYKDYFYAGVKLASADYPLKSFHIGKKFNLKNSFFIKTELSYSMLTEDSIFEFSSIKSEKITLSF